MYRIIYTCKVLTPMWLKGVNKTEMRAASIKGAMRYWWRAIGSFASEEEMRLEEGRIFGCVGESSLKSNFKLRAYIESKDYIEKENPLPHKDNMKEQPMIKVGTYFKVEILVNNYLYQAKEEKKNTTVKQLSDVLQELFEITSILGSLGGRARRGFGAFCIESKEVMESICSVPERTEFNFEYNIQSIYKKINHFVPDTYKLNLSAQSIIRVKELTSLTQVKEIKIGRDQKFFVLLKKIGQASREFRNNKGYKDQQIDIKIIGKALGKAGNERLASPLYISVIPGNSNNQVKVISVFLNCKGNEKLTKKVQEHFLSKVGAFNGR